MSFYDEKLREARALSLAFLSTQNSNKLTPLSLGIDPNHQYITDGVGLLGHIQQKIGDNIYVYDTIQSDNVNGYFQRYTMEETTHPHINLYYNPSLNDCWRRIIIAKEISHEFLAIPKKNQTATIGEIERLFNRLISGGWNASIDDDSADSVEIMAYNTAIALLLPDHQEFSQTAKDMNSKGYSDYDIALKFKIPTIAINYYLTRLRW